VIYTADILASMRTRFTEKFKPNAETGCWDWTASKDLGGYGMFSVARSQSRRAHRISYQMFVGQIPDGLVIDHLCRNRGCVNPEHLEPVTASENAKRGLMGDLRPPTTHCVRGHEYTADNTRHVVRGGYKTIVCRACESLRNDRKREARQSRKLLERAA
jgi:hypothetical protein